jgi:flagellar basal body P-ring protein FlgI
MKPTGINVQITRNPKQYEAVRLGLEATLDTGDTVENAIKAATAQLNAIYEEMYQAQAKATQTPQNAPKNDTQAQAQESVQAEPLKFGDPRLQQVVARIEKAAGDPNKIKAILENVHKYFAPDAESEKVIALAAKLNN